MEKTRRRYLQRKYLSQKAKLTWPSSRTWKKKQICYHKVRWFQKNLTTKNQRKQKLQKPLLLPFHLRHKFKLINNLINPCWLSQVNKLLPKSLRLKQLILSRRHRHLLNHKLLRISTKVEIRLKLQQNLLLKRLSRLNLMPKELLNPQTTIQKLKSSNFWENFKNWRNLEQLHQVVMHRTLHSNLSHWHNKHLNFKH